MFSYIIGRVVEKDINRVILDNYDIGYEIRVSSLTAAKLQLGERYKLYTWMVTHDGGPVDLYGFYDKEEMALFHLLNRANGVGSSTAMDILSSFSPERVVQAILTEDSRALCQVPGVGKKKASQIIFYLKEPLEKMGYLPQAEEGEGLPPTAVSENKETAIDALVNLGYSRNEAEAVLAGLSDELALDEMIRRALQQLARE